MSLTHLFKNPRNLAMVLGGVIALWVLSGVIFPSAEPEPEEAVTGSPAAAAKDRVTVQVAKRQAQPKIRYVVLNGVTEPQRITLVEAQTEGVIEKILVEEGALVVAGTPLLKIEMRDRQEKLNEAQALVKQRRMEFAAAKKLHAQGYQSDVRLAQTEAALASAKRTLQQAELEVQFTTVKAPYDGRVERMMVEEGDLAGRGMAKQTVMEFVDLDPLIVRGEVAEQDIGKIRRDVPAKLRLVDGRELEGKVSYVGRVADADTRTFRVEVEVPNDAGAIPAGLSAEISLPAETLQAYRVSASVLALDDAGKVGVKVADAQGVIHFRPVSILSQSAEGVWVSGLTDEINLVTVGSNFISDGQQVDLNKVMERADGGGE